MYLLMLLATFMASLYGYNLSARPDYDRDIVKKKAMAVVYKFTNQHRTIRQLALDIFSEEAVDSDGNDVSVLLPGDIFYADASDPDAQDNEDIHTFLKQNDNGHINKFLFYLRTKNKNGDVNPGGNNKDYLIAGRQVFDGSEMLSMILCLDKPMQETDSKFCESQRDGEGHLIKSCCNENPEGGKYIISYKKLDARWINRISSDVNFDFTRAFENKSYYDNIGVISWKKAVGDTDNAWHFRGKINFRPAYAKELEEWEDQYGDAIAFPVEKRNLAGWKLPTHIFTQSFFVDKDGNPICTSHQPCLFKIQSF